jgi:hypothetical protein
VSMHLPRSQDLVLTPVTQAIPVSPESAQLDRIIHSGAFRASVIHRVLLTYLVEKSLSGEGDSLKEYTVGLEVFREPTSYDPRTESTVRMHVARVRQKLAEYYQTEGISDRLIIGLPKAHSKSPLHIAWIPRAPNHRSRSKGPVVGEGFGSPR